MDKALCRTHSWAELLSVDLEISYLLPKYKGGGRHRISVLDISFKKRRKWKEKRS